MSVSYVDMVKDEFSFLMSDFFFAVIKAEEDPVRYLYHGVVVFESPDAIVSMAVEKGTPHSAYITRKVDKAGDRWRRDHGISLDWIVEYKTTSPAERLILLSASPDDERDALEVEGRRYMENARPLRAGGAESISERVRQVLADESRLLRRHCREILSGDFREWLDLHEYNLRRSLVRQLRTMRRSGKSTSLEKMEEDSGESLEYLTALRREYHRA